MPESKATALTSFKIDQVIQDACARISSMDTVKWSFRRATPTDIMTVYKQGSSYDENRLYGLVAREKSQSESSKFRLATFFLAYSTWDGRVLFRDYEEGTQELEALWYYVMANIATDLDCSRVVWTHYGEDDGFHSTDTISPERLPGWLTLEWSAEAMQQFAGPQPVSANVDDLKVAFASALQQQDSQSFSLRLAAESDVDHIARLVHGLAVYEKEPESVHIGTSNYLMDSLQDGTERPLFHCVLIAYMDGKDSAPHTCGMAFCYVGFNLMTGRFLYLEDLFFEEPYRGKGGGTVVMKALARLALSLSCTRMKWQALDWNTPALTFYEKKLGAAVNVGLDTSRLMGGKLTEFAQLDPV
eukprot:CAMPEP_0172463268 /NCGR_PEP_ID=MMETSP1065-20121228/46546_1 /TAXON_ID=265537 /ORGANISM="Amphiprora paludosa, Strain CCMP125" /LENGTH=357 /DNA_ID=CAMNT_0013219171 /DNA_START=22 /DNA_END=1095 /DNA_ORIENTATION=-